MSDATYSPDILLLSALESALLGLPCPQGEDLGAWAGEAVDHLRGLWPEQAADVGLVPAVAAKAFRDMMCGGSWQYLLEDALSRPRVFARTLGIMLTGGVRPGNAAVMQ